MSARERALLDRLIEELDQHAPIAPDPRDVARALGVPVQAVAHVAKSGVAEGSLVESQGGIVYARRSLDRLLEALPEGEITVAAARDTWDTSRRFADAVLAGLEGIGRIERRGGTCRRIEGG